MKRITLASSVLVLVASLSGCATDATDEDGLLQSSDEQSLATIPPGRPDLRIAVVGAGPSGLTAAYTLKGLGYTNVTVFEKENRVGGKVNSLVLGDVRAELGAVFASPDYRVVLGLADELGVPYVEYNNPRFILDEDGTKRTFQQFLLAHYTPAQIQAAIAAYAGVLQQFPEIDQDGFVGIHPDLKKPFDEFATQYGIQPIAQMAKSLYVGFGYGYYEQVPAIYALKLIPWLVKLGGPAGIQSPPYYVFPTGYQSLWTTLATRLNVRLNATVTKVERPTGSGPIRVTINGIERKEFDAVIVSAPFSSVPKFVVLNTAEKALFAKIETIRYFVSLFAAANLPRGETNFVQGNSKPSGINHVLAWGNPGGDLPIYIAYQITTKTIPAALVSATLILDILHLGGGVASPPLIQKEWTEYFPHVKTAAMRAGFFEQVDALQGNRGLFYVGGSLSFETVEHSARYAQSLVEEYFPAN